MHLVDDLKLAVLSLKQINYLKTFRDTYGLTTSQLAEKLDLSKPTVTEMVKKFMKIDCLYKQSCPEDGRVYYLKLTPKGEKIANLDVLTYTHLADKIVDRLEDEDILTLIDILKKLD